MEKKHFKYIDIFRAILCLAVLLYHLGILKGGYLAVCCFFALSGYLSTTSLLSKEKVDLKKYYLSRLKKIYLPLVVVVFTAVGIISLFKDVIWVSLKPETTSVLLGYNNFWQIAANQDYFARHTSSPFMHFWYIGILLQFELFYPFVFLLLKSTAKIKNYFPAVLTGLLTVISTIFFYLYSKQATLTVVYYNTFSRLFSLLFGITTGFISSLQSKKFREKPSLILYFISMIVLLILFLYVDPANKLFAQAMIFVSLLSCFIIEFAVSIKENNYYLLGKILKIIAEYSYEIYLVQYPIIYLYQLLIGKQENIYLNSLIISAITFLFAFFVHFALHRRDKQKTLQLILCILLLLSTSFGAYKYALAQDHTAEMKMLEEQLAANAAEMEKQKEEYIQKQKEENDAWEKLLSQLEPDEQEIKQTVTQLPIICIGDSVMLGAANNLKTTFPNSYVDAAVSRTGWAMNTIIQSLNINGPVVIHAGTNGDVPEYIKDQIMAACGNNDVFWITVTNDRDVHVNDKLKEFIKKYDNAHLIDWQQYSQGHTDWFYSDGIHLPEAGRAAYCQLIFDSIYQVKVAELEKLKQQALQEHQDKIKNKISFYGNDMLISIYDLLQKEYPDSNFNVNENIQLEDIIDQLKEAQQKDALTNQIVILLDKNIELTSSDYQIIKNICAQQQLVLITQTDYPFDTISLETLLENNPNFLFADQIHLTAEGNQALLEIIKQALKKE
ncbi:MAG: acyltransferase family protein [Erysipelotrichia bacterium]|nr:acyltransferase family protein [Erysipelotrichia bacterium]